jgi:pimeloyl-ACP methyl ester carboxylesterase
MTTPRSVADIDLQLPGRRVTGIATYSDNGAAPLLVCIHGGSYTAGYFDVPGYSLLDVAVRSGFSIAALNRPGYAGSDPVDGAEPFTAQAAVLHDAIARLWERQTSQRSTQSPGVVVIAHSIGAAIAVHLASQRTTWPLLGLALHGIGDVPPQAGVASRGREASETAVIYTPEMRRRLMYGPAGTYDPAVLDAADFATAPMPLAEALEVRGRWLPDARTFAARVPVPVHYVLAEYDALWEVSAERLAIFAGYFRAAPSVEAAVFTGSGHNIDHHLLGALLHHQQIAFALRCSALNDQP